MGTEEAIIYSYDLATVPSVIPAFANAKDVLVCDEVSLICSCMENDAAEADCNALDLTRLMYDVNVMP